VEDMSAQTLVTGSTNASGRWLCQQWFLSSAVILFHETWLFRGALENCILFLFSIGFYDYIQKMKPFISTAMRT
jgi:hypothetical protein